MGRLLAIGLLVAAAGIAVIVVNGPGTDKPEETEARTPERSSPRPTVSQPEDSVTKNDPSARGVRVRMRRLQFLPESVTAEKGDRVLFVTDDDVAHTVYPDLGAPSGKFATIDSGRIAPGETFTFTAGADGEIAFICTLHPSVMKGQVLVESPAA